jgi:hypothetical protein
MGGLSFSRSLRLFGFSIATAACTSSSSKPQPVPDTHYASAPSCRTTRPVGPFGPASDGGAADAAAPIDAGADICAQGQADCCQSDADCTAGKNGRCTKPSVYPVYPTCTYDDCFTDSDCDPGKACVCDDGNSDTFSAVNSCLPATCRVDSDCGGGYCSPSFATDYCNGKDYYAAVTCHTSADDCSENSDCPQHPGSEFPAVFCAFSGDVNKWICVSSGCSG